MAIDKEMVLVKVIHPGIVKMRKGILPAPVNRIIKMEYGEACMLKAQGVSITFMSKVPTEKKPIAPGKKVKAVKQVAEEAKEEVKEQPKQEETPAEEAVEETTSAKEVEKEVAKEETTEAAPAEEKAEEPKQEEASKETPAEEAVEEKEEESSDEVTLEDIEKCNSYDELKAYAEQLGISSEGLSKKKLKNEIIKALKSEE